MGDEITANAPPLMLGEGLENRWVVVTGAAGGIGSAIVTQLDRCGARVLAVDRTAEGLDALSARVDRDRHDFAVADLLEPSSVDLVLARCRALDAPLSGLAHMAGVLRRSDLESVSEEDWDLQVDVNLKATFFLTRAIAERLAHLGTGGSIVLASSQGWWSGGFGGSIVYNATKGAIVTMARGFARTYGPLDIRVNTIAPGLIDTPMLTSDISTKSLNQLVESTPAGRLGTADEVAASAIFLLSNHASYVNGATMNVSGGFLMY